MCVCVFRQKRRPGAGAELGNAFGWVCEFCRCREPQCEKGMEKEDRRWKTKTIEKKKKDNDKHTQTDAQDKIFISSISKKFPRCVHICV